MASLKRQLSDPEKQQVLAQQRRNGVLYCFVDDHPVENDDEVEFHHIKPFSEDGPTEIANIGAVCITIAESAPCRSPSSATSSQWVDSSIILSRGGLMTCSR